MSQFGVVLPSQAISTTLAVVAHGDALQRRANDGGDMS